MFSRGSLRPISFAMVTPSFVIVGDPNFLSRTTLRPFGPIVTLTASARRSMPRLSDRRAVSSKISCFAKVESLQVWSVVVECRSRGRSVLDDGEDVLLADDQEIVLL